MNKLIQMGQRILSWTLCLVIIAASVPVNASVQTGVSSEFQKEGTDVPPPLAAESENQMVSEPETISVNAHGGNQGSVLPVSKGRLQSGSTENAEKQTLQDAGGRTTKAPGAYSRKQVPSGEVKSGYLPDSIASSNSVSVATRAAAESVQDEIISCELSRSYYVKVGFAPVFPASVRVNYKSGALDEKAVEWEKGYLTDGSIEKAGTFAVNGRLIGTEVTIAVQVSMVSDAAALLNYSTGIETGQRPVLPEGRPAVLSDGTILDASFPVVWEDTSTREFRTGITEVKGTASVFGKLLPVTAFVRVGEKTIAKGENVAKYAEELTQNIPKENQSGNLEAIRDGSLTVDADSEGGSNQTVWTNRGNRNNSKTAEIKFCYAAAKKLEKVKLYYFMDAQSVKMPKDVKFYASDSEDTAAGYKLLSITKTEPVDTGNGVHMVEYTFDKPETAVYLKIVLTASEEKAPDGGNCSVGLAEAELYAAEGSFELNSSEKISAWRVHGMFASSDQLASKIFKTPAYDAHVEIISDKNAAYTILPAYENVIRIITESENHKKRAEYQVLLKTPADIPAEDSQSDYPVAKLTAEAGNYQAQEPPQRVLDNDPDTLWHTDRNKDTLLQDRWITLILQEESRVKALRYLPGSKEGTDGRVTKYKVEISSNNQNWKEVSAGTWENVSGWKAAVFDQTAAAKYVRLTGVECTTGSAVNFMSAAEIRVVSDNRVPQELSGAVITLPQEEYLYTGNEIRPRPVLVMAGGKSLVYGLDYILSYKNNIAEGTAELTVTGVNEYTGTAVKAFRIAASVHQVSFETNGGTPAAAVTVAHGGKLTEPLGVTRQNYELEGWYRDGALLQKWNFAADTVTEDMVLYAKWVNKATEKYKVTFDSNGGSKVTPVQVYRNNTVKEPTGVTRKGYRLEGWYKDEELTSRWNFSRDKVTGDLTLYAKWTIVYTVTFAANGGSSVQAKEVVKNGLLKEPTGVTRSGYTLEGWYKNTALTSKWNFATDKVNSNLTLYAKWTAVTYQVTFETNGGSSAAAIEAAGDSLIKEPVGVTKKDYVLEGWYTDAAFKVRWDFAKNKITRSMTLYAKWTEKTAEKYTVTFETNGGSTAAPVQIYKAGSITEPSGVTKNGYELEGWYRDAAFKTRWNFATGKVTGNLTLYAKWVEQTTEKYTIYFETNGGSAAAPAEVYKDGTVAEPFGIVKEGCILEGWYQDAAFSVRWDFAAGRVTGNLTLYANWIEEEKQTFLVSFETYGGSEVAPAEVELEGLVPAPSGVAREGRSLEGWYQDAALTEKWDFAADRVTEALTLYAKWMIEFQEEIHAQEVLPVSYSGNPFEPELKVYDGETLLTYGKDYTVSYKNNIYVWDGTEESKRPQAVIQGKGNYSSKTAVPVYLEIMPKNIEEADIIVNTVDALNYNRGKKLNVPFTVKYGKKILSKTKDLKISYEKDGRTVPQVDSLGSYTIVAEGKGNYRGTIRKNVVVVDESKKKLVEKLSFKLTGRNAVYTGEPITVESAQMDLLIEDGDTVLYDSKSSTEEKKAEFLKGFEILYKDNQEIGTASVTVRAREENGNYTGSRTILFKIMGQSIRKAKFKEGSFLAKVPFTGQKQEQKPKLYIEDSTGERNLTEGIDYTIAYKDHVKAGRAVMEIIGKGAYYGVLKKGFTITPVKFSMEKGASNVSEVEGSAGVLAVSMAAASYEQNRAGVEPKLDLVYRAETGETYSLIEGEDYILSYRNNKNVSTEIRVPAVDVKLTGNFTGRLNAVKTFTIIPKPLDGNGIRIETADRQHKLYTKEYKTKVTVYDNGVKLDGKDFKVESYQDNDNEGFEAGSQKDVTVKITSGISGNYTKTATATFQISERLIDKAVVKVKPKAYTGEEVRLTKEDIIQSFLGKGETKTELTEGVDYIIAEDSYVDNVKCGTAKVTVEGIGNYAGSKEITFKILPKEFLVK